MQNDEEQPTVASPIKPVVSLPSEWQIITVSGAKAIFHKGLSLKDVIESFTNDRPNDEIISIRNLAI